jgi:hypothetical protein
MATCKLCDKSGWFLRLSKEGLCKSCRPGYADEMRKRANLMGTHAEAIEQSQDIDTILTNLKLGIENFEALLPYEDKGIYTTKPPPSECIANWTEKKGDVVVSSFRHLLSEARGDAREVATLEGRIGPLAKLAEGLAKYEADVDDKSALDALGVDIRTEIAVQTADFHTEAAREAEGKEETGAALDHYRQALAALKADGVDGASQQARITEIESRIAALGGEDPWPT